MARTCGAKGKAADSGGILHAAGRLVGWLALAGPAAGLLAAVVLVPAWEKTAEARYVADCRRVHLDDGLAQKAAKEQLLAALPHDPTLNKRLAEDLLPCTPENEVVIRSERNTAPDVVHIAPGERPAPPPQWLTHAATRLSNPPTKRGVLLLALIALGAAYVLFGPPGMYVMKQAQK